MNILFFITPKAETAYIPDSCTLRQALEKMEYHKYTAIPILDKAGHYVGTLTEGDLLRAIKDYYNLNMHEAEDINILKIRRRWKMDPVNINCDIEDLMQVAMRQNFVPVVDDNGVFIGIITRKAIIQYCIEHSDLGKKKERKKN
ncbi:MAG: CBS domain-containing protein [Eubacterium sp.]|jgi:CBS domain-containing protein|nr:CBS domain-containing protein [Eubacterium sp.]